MSSPVISLTLPARYPFVAVAGVVIIWLTCWQGLAVDKLRKVAKIQYPHAYADKAECETNPAAFKFNCAQRAHYNTLETMPQTLFAILFTGIRYPIIAASLGATWIIGRIAYTRGYINGGPEKRMSGLAPLEAFSFFGLILGSTFTAGQMVYDFFMY